MDKIFLFARDPGGANVIIPLIKALKKNKYELLVYGKDVALEKFKKEKISAKNIELECKEINPDHIENLLINLKPKIVITGTSADDYTEKFLWSVSKKLGIGTFAILDQWMNYGIRFSEYSVSDIEKYEIAKIHKYIPDKIFVMDEYSKNKIIEEGISKEKIIVVGHPHFEYIQKKSKEIQLDKIDKYKEKINLQRDEILIVYASEPLLKTYGKLADGSDYWGYNEKTNFEELCRVLQNKIDKTNIKFRVIVKLHPKEDDNSYDELLKYYNGQQLNIIIEKKEDPLIVIKSADIVIGMSSMFLLESVSLNKEVMSLQINLKQDNPFILDKIGILKSITKREELINYFENIDKKSSNTDFNIELNSVARIIDYLEGYICQKN